ncbi:MAG: hypothetical protein OXS35_00920, partial [Dehalococcoidia bacterium]|nr:hypothetical protein [Dehalococcoidia bacterium]
MMHATNRFKRAQFGDDLARSLVAAALILAVLGGAICEDSARPEPQAVSPDPAPTRGAAANGAEDGI